MKNLLPFILYLNFIHKILLKKEDVDYDYILEPYTSFKRKAGVMCTFLLQTNFYNYNGQLDPVDMEKQLFDLKLVGDDETALKMRCHFWMTKEYFLRLICTLLDDPKGYNKSVKINESYFSYKDKKIKIFSSYLQLKFISNKYPFLYANRQEIDLNDGKNIYILKFNVGAYYDKNLFLRDNFLNDNFLIPLDNCKVVNNIMFCPLTKEKIKTFAYLYENFDMAILGIESFDVEYINEIYVYVSEIIIKFEDNIQRENINVEITKVIDKVYGNGYFIVFETNVTNFQIFKSESFKLNFTHSDTGKSEAHKCYFRKNADTPLLILCESYIKYYSNGTSYTLNKIDKLNISNINIYHNFIISYSKDEIIIPAMTYFISYDYIYAIYPDILNFTSKDIVNITFKSNSPIINEVVLNPTSQDLKCEKNLNVYRCIVPKSHFNGAKSGLYYIYHATILTEGNKVKNYELPPLKVILSDSDESKSSYKNIFSYFLGIYLILILIYY